jgi:ribosomal protein S18 acetylase RimI-like enzyme
MDLEPADAERHPALLAALRAAHAAELDPYSILEGLPTATDLAAALSNGRPALVARTSGGELRGYGLVHGWLEADGTDVRLLDVWAAPGHDRAETESALFTGLETVIREDDGLHAGIVLGANSRDTESDRIALLIRLGFEPTFDMVELELTDRAPRTELPIGVALRQARPDDATALAALLELVWSGRPYFTPPTPGEVARWLAEADPELYLVAEDGSGPIGLASAVIAEGRAEIDDLGVAPAARGRGIGAALVSALLDRLDRRGASAVRLRTEAHDPAGALRLYRRLGFTVVGRSRRFRKPL